MLGISPDSVESHVDFRDKFKLNFPLLADVDRKVAERYGAWREKNMYGKRSMGIPALNISDRRRRPRQRRFGRPCKSMDTMRR